MVKTPKIDLSRLDALREASKAARAASSKAQDEISDLTRQRSQIAADITNMQERVRNLTLNMDRRELAAAVAAKRDAEAALTERIQNLQIKRQPLTEKAQAAGALYRRCAEYAGVDPNA